MATEAAEVGAALQTTEGALVPNTVLEPVKRRLPPAAGMGRVKGNPNKMTVDLKKMILGALEAAGNDLKPGAGGMEYLRQQAAAKPAAFMALVGKVLPMQLVIERPPPTLDLSDLTDEQLDLLQKAVKGLLPVEQDEALVIEGVVGDEVEAGAPVETDCAEA